MRKLITTAALAAITAFAIGCDNSSEADTESTTTAAETESTRTAVDGNKRRGGRRIARFDTDGDGKLNETERAAMSASRVTQMLEAADTDKDGAISKEEAAAVEGRQARMFGDFTKLDADGDGSITEAELGEAIKNRRRGRRGRRSR